MKDPIKPRAKSKDVSPLCRVYVEYPLPTEWNLGGTVTGIGDRMGGPHAFNSLTPYTRVDPAMSSRICPYCNRSHNGRDQLMNHLRFHYRMVLVCPICIGCGSNSWRTVKAHIKACARQRPGIASRKVNPGECLWWRTDHTRAEETATTFKLPTRTNPPDDANQEDRGHLIDKTLTEMQGQLKALEEEAPRAAECKMSTHGQKAKDTDQNNKGDGKESKSKQQTHSSKSKQKAKSIDLTSDDLDGHFGAFLDKYSQETTSTAQEDSQPGPLTQDQHERSAQEEGSLQPDASVSCSSS